MKKLFLISALCLAWGESAYAEMLKLEKCYSENDFAPYKGWWFVD
jgi:hypothetical protein